jgi:hypothetical protein
MASITANPSSLSADDLNKVRKVLNIDTDYNPECISPCFFYPAGSLNSHKDSMFDTEEEIDAKAENRTFEKYQCTDDENSILTNGENIIDYEPITPTEPKLSENSQNVLGKIQKIGLKSQIKNLYTLSHPLEYDELFIEEEHSKSLSSLESDQHFDEELTRLQDQLKAYASETSNMRKTTNESTIEVCDKGVQTENVMDDPKIAKLKQELEDMKQCCLRYEEQNLDLRREIQLSATELLKIEKSHHELQDEILELNQRCSVHEQEMLKLIEIADGIASIDRVKGSWDTKRDKHVYNYLASTLEIIRSQLGRNKAKYQQICGEKNKLYSELTRHKQSLKSQNSESEAVILQLKSKLKIRETTIHKLEKKIIELKTRLLKSSSKDSLMPRKRVPSETQIRTSSRLSSRENSGCFSRDGEFYKNPGEIPFIEEMHELSKISEESSHYGILKHRNRYAYESDEDGSSSKVSKRDSLNNTSSVESIQMVPNRYSVRNRTPEILCEKPQYKDAIKELRDITTRANKAVAESSQNRYSIKQNSITFVPDVTSPQTHSVSPLIPRSRESSTPKLSVEMLSSHLKQKARASAREREQYYEELKRKYASKPSYSPNRERL